MLRIPASGKQTSSLFTSLTTRFKLVATVKQIQSPGLRGPMRCPDFYQTIHQDGDTTYRPSFSKVNPDTIECMCGQANSIWVRYEWTGKVLNPERKVADSKISGYIRTGLSLTVLLYFIFLAIFALNEIVRIWKNTLKGNFSTDLMLSSWTSDVS